MSYSVRPATVSDLEKLVQFTIAEAVDAEGSEIGANVREGVLTALEDNSYATYWVLETAGVVIGNVSVVKEWSDWNAGHYWWIQSMFIEPDHRGKGLIKLLLDTVQQEATQAKALELRLYVHKENSAAISAYLKNGFGPSDYQIMTAKVADQEG
ncbi:GNAT family N-acetyltransferase [Pseudomonas nitroreducens]|uniref:GNAT family N-acetyltransferase n=1 Tax=Pseudomonas nitroreducens TaxID=46680 RepID=UPI0020A19359|nr:GNAT family N-acetyltransferase [Pseudomonas nitroreducens]MCP1625975.1 GNAT superfamily N-acetyltransferase [Pseudomonas nitroreducens]